MSELPIASKDDVETALVYDWRDPSTVQEVKYSYWVLGSAHGDDALYMGTIKGNTLPSEHGLEQIKKALSRVPAERIFPPLPFPWWLVRTRVTVADDWDEEPSHDLYLKLPWITNFQVDAQPGEVSVARWFAHEIKQLEQLARSPPHSNLLRYHGCRVRNGRVTGTLLARVPGRDLVILTSVSTAVRHWQYGR